LDCAAYLALSISRLPGRRFCVEINSPEFITPSTKAPPKSAKANEVGIGGAVQNQAGTPYKTRLSFGKADRQS